MVLEEETVEGHSSSGGKYTGGNAGAAYPVNMGPGAIMSSQPEFTAQRGQPLESMLQQVQEIRSHYSFEVRDRILFLGYDLNGAARRYSLSFGNMPLSGASTWLLYGGPMRTRVTSTFVIDTIRGAENLANRPLTQREAEGYAHHASRRTLYSFASTISAVWLGSVFAIYSRKTMKFPFRKPQPLERYDNFPNRWLPALKGSYARTAWQFTRFNVYTILCLALIAPVYASMGDSAMMVGLYKDQRTHEVTKGMAAALKNTNGRLQRHASNRPGSGKKAVQVANDPQGDTGLYASSDQSPTNDYSDGKEYSGDTSYTDGTTDTGLLGDSQMQSPEARRPSPSSFTGNPAFHQKPVGQSGPGVDNSPDPDFIFDDASPTAGDDSDVNGGRGSTGPGSGSAWERVRRVQSDNKDSRSVTSLGSWPSSQSPRTGQTVPSGGRDESETNADSFSFPQSERDRQIAKEQAQKDFDRMLDEERKGLDGGNVAGGGGGWSRRRGD